MPQLTDSMYTCDELHKVISDYEQKTKDELSKIQDLQRRWNEAEKARHAAHDKVVELSQAWQSAPEGPARDAARRAAEEADKAYYAELSNVVDLNSKLEPLGQRYLQDMDYLEQLRRLLASKVCPSPKAVTSLGRRAGTALAVGTLALAGTFVATHVGHASAADTPKRAPAVQVAKSTKPPFHKWYDIEVKAVDQDGNLVPGGTFGLLTGEVLQSSHTNGIPRAPELADQGNGSAILAVDYGWQGTVTYTPPPGWVLISETPSAGQVAVDLGLVTDNRGFRLGYHWGPNGEQLYEVIFQVRKPVVAQPPSAPSNGAGGNPNDVPKQARPSQFPPPTAPLGGSMRTQTGASDGSPSGSSSAGSSSSRGSSTTGNTGASRNTSTVESRQGGNGAAGSDGSTQPSSDRGGTSQDTPPAQSDTPPTTAAPSSPLG